MYVYVYVCVCVGGGGIYICECLSTTTTTALHASGDRVLQMMARLTETASASRYGLDDFKKNR